MFRKAIALIVTALALNACVGGGTPGKAQVQAALERLAKEMPILFGSDKPIVKDAKCTKAGTDSYDCVVSLATTSTPEPMTANVKLTKLSGEWHAQMSGVGGLGG